MNAAPDHWLNAPLSSPYRWTMLGAILISAVFWIARSRRDPTLLPVYIGALGGAFLGAKLAYIFAEGPGDWSQPDRWMRLAAGKSVVGGLLGGYGGVEAMKWMIGYRKVTGDIFAFIVPLGIALGRVGCIFQGCCLGKPTSLHLIAARDSFGVARWPASQIELGFQIVIFAVFAFMKKRGYCIGRLFFIYLASYGVFRFVHEFVRDIPPLVAGLTGYQILSLLMAVVGVAMFVRRGNLPPESCAA